MQCNRARDLVVETNINRAFLVVAVVNRDDMSVRFANKSSEWHLILGACREPTDSRITPA